MCGASPGSPVRGQGHRHMSQPLRGVRGDGGVLPRLRGPRAGDRGPGARRDRGGLTVSRKRARLTIVPEMDGFLMCVHAQVLGDGQRPDWVIPRIESVSQWLWPARQPVQGARPRGRSRPACGVRPRPRLSPPATARRRPAAPRRGSRLRLPAHRLAARGPTAGASSRHTPGARCGPSGGHAR